MEKKGWTFISYLFHPAIMPAVGIFIVLWCDPNLLSLWDAEKYWLIVVGIVFSCTCLLPLLINWILLLMGRISSLLNPTDNDRRFILAFSAPFFLLAYYAFQKVPDLGESLKIFLLGINISLIATLITSLFIPRVSFHSVGVGGLLGTVIGLMKYTDEHLFIWLAAAFAVVILTGLARYRLKVHDAFEIYIGLIIGIAVQALVFFWGVYIS